MSLSVSQGTFMLVNNATKHTPYMTGVNVGFSMTSTPSIRNKILDINFQNITALSLC